MSLRNSDAILIDPEAIEYLEAMEEKEGSLSKFEVIEFFFEWLKIQPRPYQMKFLREALND